MPRTINPDDYLETPEGRVFTRERNRQAWKQAYADLETALVDTSRLYLVIGVQGAGKSSWISRHAAKLEPRGLFFDAALPARQHRTAILALAHQYQVPVTAVFIQASLQQALERNAARRPDKIVPEAAVRSVFAMLERPSLDEGFEQILVVDG